MSSGTVRAAVRDRIATGWVGPPLVGDVNLMPTLPDPADYPDGFMALDFLAGDEEIVGIGGQWGNVYREVGLVQVHIFRKSGEGDDALIDDGDRMRELFRHWKFANGQGRTWGVDPPITGPGSANGNWYRATVAFDYRFDLIAPTP